MGEDACWVDEVCPDCGRVRGDDDREACPSCAPRRPLLTVGHGTASQDELTALLAGAGVEEVVDVRRFPGSRRHPHVARDELARWLPEAGIGYRWEPRLGGRRRPDDGTPHVGLRNASFRAYADHMSSEEFTTALDELLADAGGRTIAIMCSESVWWRCHRRMVADAVVLLRGVPVEHLMHDGRRSPHQPTDVARVDAGELVYADAVDPAPTLFDDIGRPHPGADQGTG